MASFNNATQKCSICYQETQAKESIIHGELREVIFGDKDEFMRRERAGADKFNAILNEIA